MASPLSISGIASLATAGLGAYSALKGGSGGANSGTTQKEIDPRLQNYIYGPDGKGGLLGDTNAIYNTGKGGMNQQMVDGLNRQYSVYSDPGNAAGYQNMASMGQSLMSNGVAGNPFTQGGPGAGLLSNIKGLQRSGTGPGGMSNPPPSTQGGPSPLFSGNGVQQQNPQAGMQDMQGMGMGLPGGGMFSMAGAFNPPPSTQGGPFKLPDAAAFSATPIPKPSTGMDTGYTGAYDGRPITAEMLGGQNPIWDGKAETFQSWLKNKDDYDRQYLNQGGS